MPQPDPLTHSIELLDQLLKIIEPYEDSFASDDLADIVDIAKCRDELRAQLSSSGDVARPVL